MTTKRIKKNAFTLIELLVVAVIIFTLTGFGLAGYNNFNQTQILKQAAEDVKSNLRDAQNRVLAGEKDCLVCQQGATCGDNDDKPLDFWKAEFSTARTYEIEGSCGDSPFGTKNFSLSSNLQFKNIPPVVTITFKPLSQGTTGSATLTIKHLSLGKCISITISPSGEIDIGSIQSC